MKMELNAEIPDYKLLLVVLSAAAALAIILSEG